MRILVIGGGLFGCSCAFTVAGAGVDVDLAESQSDLMMGASLVNHNRIHLGYHYLRSIATAEQSIEGLLSFLFNFGDSVIHQFPNYYGIAREGSKSTSQQFVEFCDKVGIGYEDEFPASDLLDRNSLDSCFRVPEPIWDYTSLKKTIWKNLQRSTVSIQLRTECVGIEVLANDTFNVSFSNGQQKEYDVVINATYSRVNQINSMVGITPRRLLYEDVLIPIFRFDSQSFGLTVMDGPFCSVMPRGRSEGEFLLYHVRESVLQSKVDVAMPFAARETVGAAHEATIYNSSAIFMPFLAKATRVGRSQIVRTVYENSDDARLSEIFTFPEVKNFYSILSGKVTTCIQVALEIKHMIRGKTYSKRFKI